MGQHFVIIGAGPAGEAAAKKARKIRPNTDFRITLIEKEEPGGLCLNKGCIPSKSLLEFVQAKYKSSQSVDWHDLQKHKDSVVTSIRTQLKSTLKREKIDLIQGTATFESPSSLKVNTKSIPFDDALIATGTSIFFPPPFDQYKDDLLTSDTLLTLTKAPKSIVIVGGGAVGLEFACLLQATGSEVTVVELTKGILPGEDPFVVSTLTRSLTQQGITIKTDTRVDALTKTGPGWSLNLSTGETIQAEQVAACVGRIPVLSSLNLDKANIGVDGDKIKLNEFQQTTNPHVYAAGDGTLVTRLAHAAQAQAENAVLNALGEKKKLDLALTPRCLYSWPEVASVGEWKYEREEKDLPVQSSRSFYKGSAKALAAGETDGFVQIVFNPIDNKICGAQIIGAHATELIHIFSVAIHAGLTKDQVGQLIFAHPTLSEMVKDVCLK